MMKPTVTISIDLELAWGNWDNLEPYHIGHVEKSERMITTRLLEIFDRYDISVTWAFVAALLDEDSAKNMPGDMKLWYAPDIIDKIRRAKVNHELGSHGGRHRYFDVMTDAEAREDILFAQHIHRSQGIPLRSFVYPRNKVAKTGLLAEHGIKVYRGEDIAWHQSIRNRQVHLGRLANLADKFLPIAPETVMPLRDKEMCNIPGSMLFLGRGGVRRFIHPSTMLSKLQKGVNAALHKNEVFHLWFHPSNFWHDTEMQFETFETFMAMISKHAEREELDIKPMCEFS